MSDGLLELCDQIEAGFHTAGPDAETMLFQVYGRPDGHDDPEPVKHLPIELPPGFWGRGGATPGEMLEAVAARYTSPECADQLRATISARMLGTGFVYRGVGAPGLGLSNAEVEAHPDAEPVSMLRVVTVGGEYLAVERRLNSGHRAVARGDYEQLLRDSPGLEHTRVLTSLHAISSIFATRTPEQLAALGIFSAECSAIAERNDPEEMARHREHVRVNGPLPFFPDGSLS